MLGRGMRADSLSLFQIWRAGMGGDGKEFKCSTLSGALSVCTDRLAIMKLRKFLSVHSLLRVLIKKKMNGI